jgi:hypothetical protein
LEADRSARQDPPTLTCEDGNGNIVFGKEINYADLSLDTIALHFANTVIHLPSEY